MVVDVAAAAAADGFVFFAFIAFTNAAPRRAGTSSRISNVASAMITTTATRSKSSMSAFTSFARLVASSTTPAEVD